MENIKNIEIICNDCAKERKRDFQKKFNKKELRVGDLIKKKFFNQEHNEHMWVKVIKIKSNGLIVGRLNNKPLVLKELRFGDIVKVRLKEISDLIKL